MDLNPDSYNLNEISNFFSLEPNHTYDQINNAFRRKHNEVTVSNMPAEQKDAMCSFFEQLKNKLVLHLTTSNVPHNNFMTNESLYLPKNNSKIDDHVDIVTNNQIVYPTGSSKEISAGIMNPIERNLMKNLVHIDTRFKQNYVIEGNTKFTFKMPTSFKNVVSMTINSFEQPGFIYNFSAALGNNTLQFALGTNAYEDITIDDGKYTKDSLITEIVRAINANNNINNVTLAISDTTGKLTFSETTASDFKVKFPAINNKVNLGFILGFTKKEYNVTATAGNRTLTAEKILDIDFNNYYYLSLNDYQGSASQPHYAVMNNNFVTKNIFAKLKNNQEDNNTDYFIKKDYFGPVTLERFTFELLDKYGNPLDISGADYSFSLELEILYKY